MVYFKVRSQNLSREAFVNSDDLCFRHFRASSKASVFSFLNPCLKMWETDISAGVHIQTHTYILTQNCNNAYTHKPQS